MIMDFILENIIVALAIASPFIIYVIYNSIQKGVKINAIKNKKKCTELINKKYPNNKGVLMPNDECEFWEVILEERKFKKKPAKGGQMSVKDLDKMWAQELAKSAKGVNIYFSDEELVRIIKEEHHVTNKNGKREIIKIEEF